MGLIDGAVAGASAQFFEELVSVVGLAHVLTDVELTRSFTTDWTGRFVGATSAVVRPGNTEEVSDVLALCSRAGVAVVPQGGNTGLVGGGVPLRGELVLSLARLTRLDDLDVVEGKVTAGAGVRLGDLQRHAADVGFMYPVDIGSRETATIGGTLATNAGGKHVIRWGDSRRQVCGIEAVLADGTVIEHLGGLTKDNTGYDLSGLLCGSEGTLGVVTAARVRVVPLFENTVTALLALDDISSAIRACGQLRRGVPEIDAIELVFGEAMELVCDTEMIPHPFAQRWPVYLLVEVSGNHDVMEALSSAVADLDSVRDAAVAVDEHGRTKLWSYRDLLTVAINRLGPPHKLDVSIPTANLECFVERVISVVADVAPDARTWLFGHIGDGNVHVNVTGVDPADTRIDSAVFGLVGELGGSISAEHGIGTAKKEWLHLCRTEAEISTFRAIKRTLDPQLLLNPNVLLP